MRIDTHCHIQFHSLDADRDTIIKHCQEHNTYMNLVGTQQETSTLAVQLAMKHKNMWASIGTHPNHIISTRIVEGKNTFISRRELFDSDYYEDLFATAPDKIIGVGETGIDFFHIPDHQEISLQTVLEKQRDIFLSHIAFAQKHDLSLIVHCRDGKKKESAHSALIQILKELNRPIHGVIHCYTGNWTQAQEYIKYGFFIGFTGIVTYPPKKTDPVPQQELDEVVKKISLDNVVIETDSPYLAPQIIRGQQNEPWRVEEVIKKFVHVRSIDQCELEAKIIENTKTLFPKIKF